MMILRTITPRAFSGAILDRSSVGGSYFSSSSRILKRFWK